MRTKKQIDKEIQECRDKLDILREELSYLTLKNINLKDKYVYFPSEEVYMHIENCRADSREVVFAGEYFLYQLTSEADDFFRWEKYGQIFKSISFLKRENSYKEITKEEYYKAFKHGINLLINELK